MIVNKTEALALVIHEGCNMPTEKGTKSPILHVLA
jgi:hypothetical protein